LNGRAPANGVPVQTQTPLPDEDLSAPEAGLEDLQELDQLRAENQQLRSLCIELEQALHEATQHGATDSDDRLREYEALLDEKTEMNRQLHERLQELEAAIADLEAQAAPPRPADGPVPREDDLLALSEELERERKQLQDDEQSLMQQMREMEVGMAKERAELARQRNDLVRLQGEIRHELERLERTGVLQSKIDGLKSRLQDASTRRGSAPSQAGGAGPAPAPAPQAPPPGSKRESFLGRLFGQGGSK
jgi:chromosome segregation ATPase